MAMRKTGIKKGAIRKSVVKKRVGTTSMDVTAQVEQRRDIATLKQLHSKEQQDKDIALKEGIEKIEAYMEDTQNQKNKQRDKGDVVKSKSFGDKLVFYQKYLGKLKSGELYDYKEINNVANQVYLDAVQFHKYRVKVTEAREQEKKLKQQQQILSSLTPKQQKLLSVAVGFVRDDNLRSRLRNANKTNLSDRQKNVLIAVASKAVSSKDFADVIKKERSLKKLNQAQQQYSLASELFKIESSIGLNAFQKEMAKRKLLGIEGVDETLLSKAKKIQDKIQKQIKNRFNEIKPYVETAKSKNYWSKVENYLIEENLRIQSKPVSQRTGKEMAFVVPLGIGSAVMGTLRKVPNVVWRNIEAVLSPLETFKGLVDLFSNKDAQNQVRESLILLGNSARVGDPNAISSISAELVGGKVIKRLPEIKAGVYKLSPSYVKAKNNQWVINKKPFSSLRDFLNNKAPKEIKSVLKEFADNPKIVLKKQTVSSGATPLSQQVNLAGQKVTAVNAAAQQLTSWINRRKVIRKPFNLSSTSLKKKYPNGEQSFPLGVRKILNKFDNGIELSKKEFSSVNSWLQKNIAKNITLLERSLYADPKGGFRVSRLGIDKVRDATFKDVLKGNFRLFDRSKPQVLIFENAKVAKFPSILKDVEKKLRRGKKLSVAETNRLINWQVKSGSGEFKPLGSTIYKGGIELEVTLAPSEYIKRIKRVGFTYIDGKKVDFVTAEVWKPKKSFVERMKKANSGKLSDKEVLLLEKDLSKNLGRKVRVETPKTKSVRTRGVDNRPVLRLDRIGLKNIRRLGMVRGLNRAKPTPRSTGRAKPTPRSTGRAKPTPRSTSRANPTPRSTSRTKPTPRSTSRTKPTPGSTSRTKPTPRSTGRAKPTPRSTGRAKPTRKPPVKFKFRWDTQQSKLSNKVSKYEASYRARKNENKPYNKKTNPRVTKVLVISDTRNRALSKILDKVDRSTAASLEIKVLGISNKVKKDIKKPNVLQKFDKKKGRNPEVLKFVEKPEYRVDKLGEVIGLRQARSQKKRTLKGKVKSKHIKKVKKSSKKGSKSFKRSVAAKKKKK